MSPSKKPELHLFIIWEKARHIEDKIIEDIRIKFKIVKVFEITWTKRNFSKNLSRFYGTKLPPGSSKEKHCGTGPFLLVVVEDKNPVYEELETSKGLAEVNSNLFSSKSLHREWSGGGHRVHATNSIRETEHDLMLLTGYTTEEFYKKFGSSVPDKKEKINSDLMGHDGWGSIGEFFKVLNHCEQYVVLRNFSVLPDRFYADKHGDIDLLVDSLSDTVFTANAKPVFKEEYRVHYKVKINNEFVLFDFRHTGDEYYDKKWEREILKNRVLNKGFYVPDMTNHFFSLLYHALLHKPNVAEDYHNQLKKIGKGQSYFSKPYDNRDINGLIKLLRNFMFINDYNFTNPTDKSVFVNHGNVKRLQGYLRSRKAVSPKHYLRKLRNFL